jgi:adenosylmethionine-8-amino-7-oxononanoate aminotransferase
MTLFPSTASPDEAEIEQTAVDHIWVHETTWADMVERHAMHVFDHGDGIYLYDVHGNRFIDARCGADVGERRPWTG